MKRAILAAAVLGLALTVGAGGEGKIKALLITGDDVDVHPWKETAAATKEILDAAGGFDVTVVEEMDILGKKDDLNKFDLVIFMRFNNKKIELSDDAKANLLGFVRDGKGFVVSHLASASFNKWEEWNRLCGRYWAMGKSGHGPRSVIKAKIADKEDPITKGVEDFEIDDELYAKLRGEEKIHVLVEADSDWSKKTEPLVFTLGYGKGRVFHDAFGHDGKAVRTPAHAKLLARGCRWAATGKAGE